MTITAATLRTLSGSTLKDRDDHKIGKIEDVYESVDGSDGTFVTVSTGLFGKKHSFVPLREATLDGEDVVVPYSKDLIHDAPRVEVDEDLTEAEEERIYSHYGLTPSSPVAAAEAPVETAAPTTVTGDDGAITLSEERLRVGTRTQESGRARLRKYVTTETQTQTVPVSHEELVIEREVITDGRAVTGVELGEEVREVTLTEEVPVVAKETVPVERVRIGTETVTDEVTITEGVSKEHIDLDRGREARTS